MWLFICFATAQHAVILLVHMHISAVVLFEPVSHVAPRIPIIHVISWYPHRQHIRWWVDCSVHVSCLISIIDLHSVVRTHRVPCACSSKTLNSTTDSADTPATGATSPTAAAAGPEAAPAPLPLPPTRAPRLYLGGSNLHVGQTVELTSEQTRYLVSVMRLRDGSLVRVFDGVNGEFLAAVSGSGEKSGRSSNSRRRRLGVGGDQVVVLRVDHLTRRQPGSGLQGGEELGGDTPDVELIFAPIRKQRLKILVEKVVEIGASRLTPVLTARTQKGALSDANALGKLGLTAIEAAEQCERMTVPRVGATPVPILSLLQDTELRRSHSSDGAVEERGIIFVCKERDLDAPPLLEALAKYARNREGNGTSSSRGGRSGSPQSTTVAFLIGPEGGFDPDEMSAMALYPFVQFVSLGPTVLRAETAAVYALSSWSAFWAACP